MLTRLIRALGRSIEEHIISEDRKIASLSASSDELDGRLASYSRMSACTLNDTSSYDSEPTDRWEGFPAIKTSNSSKSSASRTPPLDCDTETLSDDQSLGDIEDRVTDASLLYDLSVDPQQRAYPTLDANGHSRRRLTELQLTLKRITDTVEHLQVVDSTVSPLETWLAGPDQPWSSHSLRYAAR